MQKSKILTIIFIIFILLYVILTTTYLKTEDLSQTYSYLINPIFWILFASFITIIVKTMYKKTMQKDILSYVAITVLTYIIVNLLSGLLVGFGQNPYATTLKGFITNIWIFGTVLIAKEIIRYKLINNVFEKEKILIGVFIIIVYTLEEYALSFILMSNLSAGLIFKRLSTILLPIIANNILCTYLAINAKPQSAICYMLILKGFIWIVPILPDQPWIMAAFIDIMTPIVLFLYVRYNIHKKEIYTKSRKDLVYFDPRHILPIFIVVILAIWFALGIFPIKPIAIATGSMEPYILVGDIAIILKCEPETIEKNDVIEFKSGNITIIHRVIDIQIKNGQYYYTTKGDNNKQKDPKIITKEDINGKVIAKIRYLGYPAIWLNIANKEE